MDNSEEVKPVSASLCGDVKRPVLKMLAVVLAVSVVTNPPARADENTTSGDSIYNTSRMLPHIGNECADVPFCESVKLPPRMVEVGQEDIFVVNCPDESPYAWHWDARHHEHLNIAMTARTDYGLTFLAVNRADVPGKLKMYVGCSPDPFDPTVRGEQTSTAGVPSLPVSKKP